MTDRPAFTATDGRARQAARGRRRRPAGNVLRAILGRVVPALAAAAMLLGAGGPVGAFPGLDQPSVSIAAERASHGFGIDDVVFTLRRAGSADDAVSGAGFARAGPPLLADRPARRDSSVLAGKREAELRIPAARSAVRQRNRAR